MIRPSLKPARAIYVEGTRYDFVHRSNAFSPYVYSTRARPLKLFQRRCLGSFQRRIEFSGSPAKCARVETAYPAAKELRTFLMRPFISRQVNNATARVQTKKPPTVPNGRSKLRKQTYVTINTKLHRTLCERNATRKVNQRYK